MGAKMSVNVSSANKFLVAPTYRIHIHKV